jgi:hypothetical protein
VQQFGHRDEVAHLPQVEVHGAALPCAVGDAFRVSPPPKEVLDAGAGAAAGWITSEPVMRREAP